MHPRDVHVQCTCTYMYMYWGGGGGSRVPSNHWTGGVDIGTTHTILNKIMLHHRRYAITTQCHIINTHFKKRDFQEDNNIQFSYH